MAGLLAADDASPGQLRKVGPSLRHVASKVDMAFLYNWVREPKDFRPSTKMPQFFGLYDHLLPEQAVKDGVPQFVFEKDAEGNEIKHPKMEESLGLKDAKRFEPVEILSVSHYLLNASQPFEYLDKPKGVTEKPSAERGKQQFETRGCLACHQHPDFPAGKQTQGPDLARSGLEAGWRERRSAGFIAGSAAPNRYHARTVMPNLFLEPIKDADGKVSDPAADITVFLLGSQGWKAEAGPGHRREEPGRTGGHEPQGHVHRPRVAALRGTRHSAQVGADLKGDEAILVTDKPLSGNALKQKKLMYLGRRTITRLGCSGCHDIPGYEDAKPIGTGLADWGRKETSKLAFEQIIPYLERTRLAWARRLRRPRPVDQGHGPGRRLLHRRAAESPARRFPVAEVA